jgi:hypothetical protein
MKYLNLNTNLNPMNWLTQIYLSDLYHLCWEIRRNITPFVNINMDNSSWDGEFKNYVK